MTIPRKIMRGAIKKTSRVGIEATTREAITMGRFRGLLELVQEHHEGHARVLGDEERVHGATHVDEGSSRR